MEDENGLNLSLGLPCGRGTASQNGKTGSSSNVRTEEGGDRDSNSINGFKRFLDAGTKKVDSVTGLHRTDLAKNEGNFFSGLSSPVGHSDTTKRLNSGGFWAANSSRSIEVGGGRTADASDSHKRKRDIDSHDKTMTSHISINTDDDSTGDNEDVADSEAESNGQNEFINKDVNDSTKLQGQKRFTISSEKEVKFGNVSYGSPFSQPVNIANMPYSLPLKDCSNPSGTVGVPSYPGAHPLVPANMPLMFGYSHVQLSSLDKGNVCVPASHLHRQQIQPPNARGSLNSDLHGDSMKITQATSTPVFAHNSSGNGKHHTAEEGSSDNARGNNNNISFSGAKDPSPELPKATTAADGLPREFPAIRPGLAADVKFGGCGSFPNLPWVSTTGLGPNGKTISGVTYRYSPTQIKIVCACHGSHMSPEEFVRHAGEERPTATQEPVGGGTGVVSSFPNSNSAASAQS